MKIQYNNLYTHFVLTTNGRQRIIKESFRIRLEKYITGIVKNNSSKLYSIYANPEHVHMLVSRAPFMSEEELLTIIAESSERFVQENRLTSYKFLWQTSASAFSVSKSDVNRVGKYILNQPEHHKKVTYEEENQQFLKFYQQTLHKSDK